MKFSVAFALVAFFAVANAKSVQQPKSVVIEIIEALIEKYRPLLANLNIPLIDLVEFGQVNNLTIYGAELFVLEALEAPGPESLDISNATITLATAAATALLNAINVQIPEIGAVINGAGPLTGSAEKMLLTVALNLRLKGASIELVDFTDLNIVVQKITAVLTGIDNQDETNAILSSALAPFLTDQLDEIANANKPVIIEGINKILANLTP